ncbi:branched-chain amino acid ABC transporter permease [Microbacterium sp. BWT-B31]|uniref:branched-chain amino acid ABC transporter permease n=1 Tax=Microbacterium sp. BWT-B31 TaxID=3232072 RepID=UPI0035276005
MTDLRVRAAHRVDRYQRRAIVSGVVIAAVVLLLSAAPYILPLSVTSVWIKLFYLIVLASTWNLLAGYAGMISVGQQAYIGLGAYGVFVLNDLGVNAYLSVLAVSIVVGAIALPISFLAFRLRGGYFAIGTWVIAEVSRQIVIRFDGLGLGRGRSISDITQDPVYRNLFTYWTALAFVVVVVATTYFLLRSRVGSTLQSIRDNETAAEAMGVKVSRPKRLVFVLAAAGAAGAGAIICIQALGVASPNVIFSVNYSAFMIFMVLIGGIGTIEGPIIGALIYFVMDIYLSQLGLWYLVILGVLAIAITLYLPRGIWGAVEGRWRVSVFPIGHRVIFEDAVAAGPRERVAASAS